MHSSRRKRKASFQQWGGTGCISLTPGQAWCSESVNQHKPGYVFCVHAFLFLFIVWWVLSILFLFYFLFYWERERTWNWVGREVKKSGKTWGRGKNMIKIYCVKNFVFPDPIPRSHPQLCSRTPEAAVPVLSHPLWDSSSPSNFPPPLLLLSSSTQGYLKASQARASSR